MSKTCCALRAAREALGARRASSSCRGRGWGGRHGGTPRGDLAATASATLERSAGTVAHGKRVARERCCRRSKVSRCRRVAGAQWEARARAARVQTAGEDLWWVGGRVVLAATPSYSMVRAAQASPDHGFCGVSARAGDPSCLTTPADTRCHVSAQRAGSTEHTD